MSSLRSELHEEQGQEGSEGRWQERIKVNVFAGKRQHGHKGSQQQAHAAEISETAFEKCCIFSSAYSSWSDKYITQGCQLTCLV
jgi:hypothetical protein